MTRETDGTPLPDESRVMRMCYSNRFASSTNPQVTLGAIPALISEEFQLSTQDKQSTPPYLSVFESSLTTIEQGKILTRGKDMALFLLVEAIRSLESLDKKSNHCLDVCWFIALIEENGKVIPDVRKGVEGHCGITGLIRPPKMPKSEWKFLRVKLAEIAIANSPSLKVIL